MSVKGVFLFFSLIKIYGVRKIFFNLPEVNLVIRIACENLSGVFSVSLKYS